MNTVSVRMDEELNSELEAVAEETHQSKSAVIKKALEFYFDNIDGIIAEERLKHPVAPLMAHEDLLREYGLL